MLETSELKRSSVCGKPDQEIDRVIDFPANAKARKPWPVFGIMFRRARDGLHEMRKRLA